MFIGTLRGGGKGALPPPKIAKSVVKIQGRKPTRCGKLEIINQEGVVN